MPATRAYGGDAIRGDALRDLEAAKHSISFWRVDGGTDASRETARRGRSRYLGMAERNPVTGVVHLKDVQVSKNFMFVDLWTRNGFTKNVKSVLSDPFLFKAKPLPLRTWFWHSRYRDCLKWSKISSTPGLGLWEAVTMRLDEVFSDWSPIMALAPMQLMVLLTGDIVALFLGLAVIIVCAGCSVATSSWRWLWATRHITFLPRVLLVIVLFVRMSSSTAVAEGSITALIGYIMMLLTSFADIFYGDIGQLRSRRLGVHYEVLQQLKNQVMICRWHGPSHLNHEILIPEQICGIPPHQQRRRDTTVGSRIVVVAVLQGILCELVPLQPADKGWFEEEAVKSKPANGEWLVPFCGCDVFDKGVPDVHSLLARMSKANLRSVEHLSGTFDAEPKVQKSGSTLLRTASSQMSSTKQSWGMKPEGQDRGGRELRRAASGADRRRGGLESDINLEDY